MSTWSSENFLSKSRIKQLSCTSTKEFSKSLKSAQEAKETKDVQKSRFHIGELAADGIQEAYSAERLESMHTWLATMGPDRFPIRVTMVTPEVVSLRSALENLFFTTEDKLLQRSIARFLTRSQDQLDWLAKFS